MYEEKETERRRRKGEKEKFNIFHIQRRNEIVMKHECKLKK